MNRLSCKEATRLASQGLDRRLGAGERLRLRIHLFICDGCRRFSGQIAFLRTAIRRLPEELAVTPGDRPGKR